MNFILYILRISEPRKDQVMSKITNIGSAVLTAINHTDMRQEELAKAMNVTQASVSRMISGKNRPSLQTLNALCSALKKRDYQQAVLVLIGHLHDEIEASGMLISDIGINPAGRKKPTRIDIEKHLDTIRTAALKSKETASLVKDIAWLVRSAKIAEKTKLSMVAEDPAPYGKKK